jgi:hypothetical protein
MDIGGDRGVTYVLIALIIVAVVGMGAFCFAWPARAHGYEEET